MTSSDPSGDVISGAVMRRERTRWPLAMLVVATAAAATDCPSMCKCLWKSGKQTVECAEQGLLTIPQHVDADTQVLDVSGNNIQILAVKKFQRMNLTNLQRIYLARCKITQVDDHALLGLTNLVELDLSENFLTSVPSLTFGDVPALMSLSLSGNPLGQLSRASFAGLQELTTLELSRCELTYIEPGTFSDLKSLRSLLLDGNRLNQLDGEGLSMSLHQVDLHNNPWTCDCHLRSLRNWLAHYPVPPLVAPVCATPGRLEGRVIRDVVEQQLACIPDISPSSMFQEVAEDHNVSFSCRVRATPPANVSWSFNGEPLKDGSAIFYRPYTITEYSEDLGRLRHSQLMVVNVTDEDQGVFRCQASNEAGTRISNFTLGVLMPPGSSVSELAPPQRTSYLAAVGASLVFLLVVLVILVCIVVIRCSRNRRRKQEAAVTVSGKSGFINNGSDTPSSTCSMPKTIQMGTVSTRSGGTAGSVSDCREHVTYIGQRCCTSPSRHSADGSNPDVISDTEAATGRRSVLARDLSEPLSEPTYERIRTVPRLGPVWRSDEPVPLVHVDVHQGGYSADFGLPRSATMGRSRSYHNHLADGTAAGAPGSCRSLPRHRHSRQSRREERGQPAPPALAEAPQEAPQLVRKRPPPPLRTSSSASSQPPVPTRGYGDGVELPLQEIPPARGLPSPPASALDIPPTLAPPEGFTDEETPIYSKVNKRRGDPNISGLPAPPAAQPVNKFSEHVIAAHSSLHESPDEGYEESNADGTEV